MSNENSKLDAERAAFDNDLILYGVGFLVDGKRVDPARVMWNRTADSLPLGVPDGYALVPVEPTQVMTEAGMSVNVAMYETHYCETQAIYAAMLAAAPTVKAEQVPSCTKPDCFPYCDCGGIDDPVKQAPSLPAAGSDAEEVEVVGYRHIASNAKSLTVVVEKDHPPVIPMVEWNAPESLMTVAQHERIVAALSAQQSAPERVSVPRDALQWPLEVGVEAQQKAADVGCDREDCLHDGLQAMLAELSSHAEGGKV